MPVKKKRPVTRSGKPRARKGVKLKPTELKASELTVDKLEGKALSAAERVRADGGVVLAAYREPLAGHVQLFCALPINLVEPTPYQRDVSDAHVRKLTLGMDRLHRFLDPIIAVVVEGGYQTPNGNHRLVALKELGAKSILALVIPDEKVAFKILALNIEKAHNLREKSLEVVRMYDELARLGEAQESDYALEFEEPALCTLGFCYRERGRFSGGAYQSALKKVDNFFDKPIEKSLALRQERANLVLALDEAVSAAVEKLKAKGLQSPYLKTFVVARCNPLRFIKGTPPSFEDLMETMTKRARGMDAAKINPGDLARSGGAADE